MNNNNLPNNKKWLQGEALDRLMGYWKQKLEGVQGLELPTDRPRPAVQTFKGLTYRTRLGKELSGKVKEVARVEGVTLNMLMLAVFKVLLYRYTQQEDIVVGMPIGKRNPIALEDLVGFFVNTLVVRTDLSGEPTFRELLQRVKETLLEAYEHQDLPFEKLVEVLNPERDLSQTPLFQVMFVMQESSVGIQQMNVATVGQIQVETETSKFDLMLFVEEEGDNLSLAIEYSTDLFNADRIERMAGHYQRLLEDIVEHPEKKIWELELLTEAEKHQILVEWNDTDVDYPKDKCLHQLFEEQVERTPEAVAVVFGEQQLTYRELNERANQLGHYLQKLGVGPEVLVGICVERSLEMIVGLLGILKAGGAYVPLDPSYPYERLQFMLEDTQAPVLLTQATLNLDLATKNTRLVYLDQDWEEIAHQSIDNVHSDVKPDNLIYVIYTSGSTGKPKGVMVLHQGVTNVLHSIKTGIGITDSDVLLAVTTLSFDIAALELYMPLCSGSRLVIARRESVMDGEELANLVYSSKATVMQATPITWRLLLGTNWKASPNFKILCGGEVLPADLAMQLCGMGVYLWNVYGPTETTIWSTAYSVVPDNITETIVSIGRPITNTKVFILDGYLQLVPVGIPGELHIGGDGLSRGYLHRPDLTEEKFLSVEKNKYGLRLYKTGDSTRYQRDGSIQFLGRIDDQVKVRGYRIELGEIESALRSHPMVQDTVVAVSPDEHSVSHLLAYVIPNMADPMVDQELVSGYISDWQAVWDEAYHQAPDQVDFSFNTAGWISSYTGAPLPPSEMREWVENAVNILLSQHPQQVLEIGCGTGLILFRVAPHCKQYWATDVSREALNYLQRNLTHETYPQVRLLERAADDFADFDEQGFDAVVLNSVVQYFPSIRYLWKVIERAVNVVRPGGTIFVGDVRSLPLLEAFYLSVELSKISLEATVGQLQKRVHERLSWEKELVIDPAFFFALQRRISRISRVEILPKSGRITNELTKFRYDAVLHIEESVHPAIEPTKWLDWTSAAMTLDSFREFLDQGSLNVVVKQIPNKRVTDDIKALKLFRNLRPDQSVAELLKSISENNGIEIEDLKDLGKTLGYAVDVSWSGGEKYYEAIFHRAEKVAYPQFEYETLLPTSQSDPAEFWDKYTNRPMQRGLPPAWPSQFRSFLRTKLPDYMLPEKFFSLEKIPLTPNGKVNRKALPKVPNLEEMFNLSQMATSIEETVAQVWTDVLNIGHIGLRDNFFDLGGNSLFAVQIITRLRKILNIEIPLRVIFETPTISGLVEHIKLLSRKDCALLSSVGVPKSASKDIPASFNQERLWILNQMGQESIAYNVPLAVRIVGDLNSATLESSMRQVIARHETLRTIFGILEGKLQQEILEKIEIKLRVKDISDLDAIEKDAKTLRWLTEFARSKVDLAHGPLFKTGLLRLAENEHILAINFHHIIIDEWSIGVFFQELKELYEAELEGRAPKLAELPIQYRDYAVWQREWLQGEVLDRLVGYWKQKLEGLQGLELPTDRPRPAVQTFKGLTYRTNLSKELSKQLKEFSRAQGVTLNMLMLTVFKVLLYRYTQQEDIAVGMPMANRNRVELENLIGFFVNTLVVRTDLSGEPAFRELLQRVKATLLEAYEHQDLPFEKLVEVLNPERDLSQTPLFQAMFVMQESSVGIQQMDVATVGQIQVETETSKFDLTLFVEEEGDSLGVAIEYSTDLYDADRIERMAGHYQRLLEDIVEHPEKKIWELELLTEAEKHQILVEWNDTDVDYPKDKCLHQLFEGQVEQSPEAVAVVFGEQQLTYRELNERANQVGHYLQKLGVGPEVLVGICVERSLEMIVGLLGILKAGGAYVPLDPSYPKERLQFMLEDTQAPVLLTQATLNLNLATENTRLVYLDQDWEEIAHQSTDNVHSDVKPDNLVYVIYTSGSTGKPKGILLHHLALLNLLIWQLGYSHPASGMKTIQFSSISFDASFEEIFYTWLSGGELILVSEETRRYSLLEYLAQNKIEVLFCPFVALQQLALEAKRHPEITPNLKEVNTAGEQLRVDNVLVEFFVRMKQCRLFNLYGPSETHVATYYALYNNPKQWPPLPPIGRPVSNTYIYILDQHRSPMPAGTVGEIYIGGIQIARGYLNRVEITRERFISDPFTSNKEYTTMYKTGDLGRWSPTGDIEFLGRLDDQVKIRGYRVELGEIEVVLSHHPAVKETTVMCREDASGNKNLVAYIVSGSENIPQESELHSYMKESCPEYMVPSTYVFLKTLPLTPSGKVNRKALPVPQKTKYSLGKEYVAPKTKTGKVLAQIWGEILRIEKVGVSDNFFEIGGHSLLATQAISRIEKEFDVSISLGTLFQFPTIGEFSSFLDSLLLNTKKSKPMIRRFPRIHSDITIAQDGEIQKRNVAD